jgi:hypothetical protein
VHGNADDDTVGKIQSVLAEQDRRTVQLMEKHTPRIVTSMAVRSIGPWN